MGLIYLVQNRINHNLYVGKTTQAFSKRQRVHRSTAFSPTSLRYNTYPNNAIRKYGWGAFDWMIIDEAATDEELKGLEREYIAYYRMIGKHLYNMTDGGEGVFGYRHSDATKAKISATHKGKMLSDEHRARLAAANACIHHLYSPDGAITEITNLRKFCSEHGLNAGAMCQVALGKKPQYKGWHI